MKVHTPSFCCALMVSGIAQEPLPSILETQTATFGGGCFWCLQPAFTDLDGVITTTVGFMGGHTENPTYNEVSAGDTGHTEVVRIVYNPAQIDYDSLLVIYWQMVDYTPNSGAINGRNTQYRSVIFHP